MKTLSCLMSRGKSCFVAHSSAMLVNNSGDVFDFCHTEMALLRFEYYSIFLETFEDGF